MQEKHTPAGTHLPAGVTLFNRHPGRDQDQVDFDSTTLDSGQVPQLAGSRFGGTRMTLLLFFQRGHKSLINANCWRRIIFIYR